MVLISARNRSDATDDIALLHDELARLPDAYRITKARAVDGTTTLTAPGASGDTVEIIARFAAKGAQQFGLNVRVGGTDRTVVGYDVTRAGIYLDRSRSGNVSFSTAFPSSEFAPLAAADGTVTLHLLVDRSSVEVLDSDGRAWITDQIFPSQNSKAIQIFADGGQAQLEDLTIWQLRSAWR